MMKDCLDTGMIQAFLDGEMSPAESSRVSAHIAACDACAAQLATAEEESSFVFSVLEREVNTLVPTQRLWSKINETIAVEKESAPFWKKAWAAIAAQLANPSIAVAAGVLVVLGLVSVVWIQRNSTSGPEVASGDARLNKTEPPATVVPSGVQSENNPSPTKAEDQSPKAVPASYQPDRRSSIVTPRGPKSPTVIPAAYIPGEESYVKTIASLNDTVSGQKDTVMRPSERVAYERDMAVVDDAIAKMKKEVRKNPKNESAKQVLYSSYQNKIDLLNSVSQREELVASLK
jgi:hypothetical protein